MSFTYRIEPGLLHVFVEGAVTQAERIEAMRSWMADPDFHPGLDTLCDLSKAQSTPTLTELHALVDFLNQHADRLGRKKLALVTAKPVTFGVARQFAVLAESSPLEVQAFSSREAALSWLHSQSPISTPSG